MRTGWHPALIGTYLGVSFYGLQYPKLFDYFKILANSILGQCLRGNEGNFSIQKTTLNFGLKLFKFTKMHAYDRMREYSSLTGMQATPSVLRTLGGYI